MARTTKAASGLKALRAQITKELDALEPHVTLAATTSFSVKEGNEGDFVRHLDILAESARRMKGQNVFSYHKRQGADDTLGYFVFEDWQSVTDFQAYWDSSELTLFQDKAMKLLTETQSVELLSGSDDVGGAPIPKTGLKGCWNTAGRKVRCKGTGQDADIGYGEDWPEPRFEDNGNGTVTDLLTGLIWLQDADRFGEVTWDSALNKAKFLAAGSHGLTDDSAAGDWRLPNVRELRSLLDYSQVAPMIPAGHPFGNVQNAIYWTSTTLASAPTLAWMTTLGIGPAVFDLKINSCRMWPVRGASRVAKTGQNQCWDSMGNVIECGGTGQDGEIQAGVQSPSPRFIPNDDGTVLDKLTGLIWLHTANPFGWCTWQQALDHCKALSDGHHGLSDGSAAGDWRLPNVLEFESLIDYGRFAPSLPPDQPFVDIQPTSYWTSTTVASAPTQAMFSILGVGPSIFENKEHPFLVWPVRSPK